MIVRPRPSALALFFILRGSIIPRIFSRILVITLLAGLVVWMYHDRMFSPAHLSAVPFSLFGLALSVFMGFRNNVCYDRWWEARKQWGELIVQCRSLARESAVLLAASTANPVQERIVRRCIGFAYALAARLREEDALAAARPWVQLDEAETLAGCRNVPDALLLAINRDLAACLRRGEADRHPLPGPDPARRRLRRHPGRLRAHQVHALALRLFAAAAPHRLAVLPAAALRAGGRAGIPDPGGGHHHRLHLLRPGRAGRRTGRPLRQGRERPALSRWRASSRSTCWKVWACGHCRSRRCRWIMC